MQWGFQLDASRQAARFGIRILARTIDILLWFVLVFIARIGGRLILSIVAAMGAARSDWMQAHRFHGPSAFTWGFIGSLLYHCTAESTGGDTGQGDLYKPCGIKAAVIRNMAGGSTNFFSAYLALLRWTSPG